MPKDAFFNNIGTILTYAVIGTLFNSFATGLSLWGVYKADLMPGLNEVHEQELGKGKRQGIEICRQGSEMCCESSERSERL